MQSVQGVFGLVEGGLNCYYNLRMTPNFPRAIFGRCGASRKRHHCQASIHFWISHKVTHRTYKVEDLKGIKLFFKAIRYKALSKAALMQPQEFPKFERPSIPSSRGQVVRTMQLLSARHLLSLPSLPRGNPESN